MTEQHHETESYDVAPDTFEPLPSTYFGTARTAAGSVEVTRHIDGSWRLSIAGQTTLHVADAEQLDVLAFLMGYSRAR